MNSFELNVRTTGVVAGMLCFIAYAIAWRDKSTLTTGAILFLSGDSIIAGVQLCILSLNKLVCGALDLEQSRPYFFLGGAAVIWISAGSIRKAFKTVMSRQPVGR